MQQLIPEAGTRVRLGGIGRTTYYQLIGSGQLVTVKIGRRRFVVADSIDAYIERLSRADGAHRADVEPHE